MHKVEIRSGIWIAYEDDWFGKPWSGPETVVMVHWQLRILARLGLVGDASGGQVPCRSSRPAGLRRLDRAARVWLERRRACRRRGTLPGCVENSDLSSDRGQIRRIGLH